ncbi:MAG: hypothetical protein ACSW75_00460 [Lachnospiraceae bacterium]
MELKYESVLRELIDIEAASREVLQGASDEQKALAEEARRKQEAFDAEIDRKTEDEIAAIRAAFAKESDEEIAKIRAESEASMAVLREKYEQQMDARAEEIVRGILAGGEL